MLINGNVQLIIEDKQLNKLKLTIRVSFAWDV